MPKIQRAISVELHEWNEWADYAEKMRMSISELIRQSVRGHIGCAHPPLPGCIVSEIDAISKQLEKVNESIGRMKAHNETLDAMMQQQKEKAVLHESKTLPVDRLINDIKTGIVTSYNPTALSKDYGLETNVIRNAWRKATGETPW